MLFKNMFEIKNMEVKNFPPVKHTDKKVHEIIKFYYELNRLKQLYRKGWLRNVPKEKCESVAEHSFGVAVLSYFLAEKYFPKLDKLKILKMALIHDFCEIYAGDITPSEKIDKEEKAKLEEEAIVKVFSKMSDGNDYINLWKEFQEESSEEAKFVKQVDCLEMVLQASVYENQGYKNLQEFFDKGSKRIKNPLLRNFLKEIDKIRRT
ncbi:MAG: HD domain-containing protein [Candidatus Aenigmatarchaeota archaeon]